MVLLIDNYDSFVHNLARYVRRMGKETRLIRNDQVTPDEVAEWAPEAIIISPGPRTPDQAGCSVEIVRQLHTRFPILGICLGHQAICEAFGGKTIRGPQPVHGRGSPINHNQAGVFQGLDSPLIAGRYHSLVADEATMPSCLEVTARTDEGTIMAVQHRQLPITGLQFHPESILTTTGQRLLENFFQLATP